jgi:hypothetical protein
MELRARHLKGEKPKQFKGSGFKPKGNFVKKGLLLKQANPRGMLVGSPKEQVGDMMYNYVVHNRETYKELSPINKNKSLN